jgi:hypothetical protein
MAGMLSRRSLLTSAAALLGGAALPSSLGAPVIATELLSLDGLSFAEGSTFMFTSSQAPSQNGMWVVSAAGSWARPSQF